MNKAVAAAIDEPTRAAAREAYNRDIYAASSHGVRDSHFNGWATLHAAWYGAHVPMLPLTVEKVHNVSSLFKEGGYASFANYISRAKDAHIAQEFPWTDALAQAHAQAVASVTRGIGPAKQATPYNIDSGPRAAEAIEGRGDYPKQYPLGLSNMLTAFPVWALREIEASNAFWRDVTFGPGTVC